MKLIIDDAIPYIKGLFEPFVETLYCKGGEFSSAIRSTRGDKILIIRTRTKCNAELLEGSGVKAIATATIGTDHIDIPYCNANSIKVFSAPGCNSGAVMQYVFTSLAALNLIPSAVSKRKSVALGVIGAGHVGEKVARLGEALGFKVMRNDPPKELQQKQSGGSIPYFSLDEVLENSDIVTIHTPLDSTTKGMASSEFFSKMKEGATFINCSRGEVLDEKALLASKRVQRVILDVWCNEPKINLELLSRADIATPHIAGYSVEGKKNGTAAVVESVATLLGIRDLQYYGENGDETRHTLNLSGDLKTQLLSFFPVKEIDSLLREAPENFEKIRTEYIYRNEFKY